MSELVVVVWLLDELELEVSEVEEYEDEEEEEEEDIAMI